MTDRGDRLLFAIDLTHELLCFGVGSQGVGIERAAGQQQRIVLLGGDVVEGGIDVDFLRLIVMLEPLNRLTLLRNNIDALRRPRVRP